APCWSPAPTTRPKPSTHVCETITRKRSPSWSCFAGKNWWSSWTAPAPPPRCTKTCSVGSGKDRREASSLDPSTQAEPCRPVARPRGRPRQREWGTRACRSRRQPLDHPAVALAPVAQSVVQPAGPPLPELDRRGPHAVAAPVGRPRHVLALVARDQLGP